MERSLFVKFSATDRFDEVDYYLKKIIREAIYATLEYEGFEYDAEVSVTFTDNSYIKKLNGRFRGINKATDVLSFPMYESGEFDIAECISGAVLGDIVISLERAREQAKELGHGFIREVAFLAIHSTLHLLGYDHERGAEDEEAQCTAQREIISGLEI